LGISAFPVAKKIAAELRCRTPWKGRSYFTGKF
jgi:hypothetical protein